MEVKDKAYLSEWAEKTTNISGSTSIAVNETATAQLLRMQELEADPESWFKYYFPKYAFATPEAFHRAAAQRILNNPEWYEVRMWSRELGKSTRAMMEVLYLTLATTRRDGLHPSPLNKSKPVENMLRGDGCNLRDNTLREDGCNLSLRPDKRNVLLISNSEDNAKRLLLPYRANLEVNNRIIQDYGIQENYGSWEAGEFITRAGIAFRAVGAGQSPRGSRNEEVRPDIILFDDIDTDEDCRNPEIIKKKWKWIEEAVMPTRSVSKQTTILFCGNRIAKDCCVVRATQFADHVDEINIRDEHGMSTWPSKNTEEHIDRVLSKLSYAAIQKEYYNNPVQDGSVFKEMAYTAIKPLSEYSLLVCYTDPSYRESKKNDFKATVLVGKWQGQFHVIKAFVFQGTTAQMIDAHYEIMDVVGECACFYVIEQVFLQELFLKEFTAAGIARKRAVPIAGDKRQKPNKFARIETLLEPLNRNGKLYLNEAEKDNPGMKTLEQQFISFSAGSNAHDDGPDAVEGAVWILNNKDVPKEGKTVEAIEYTRNSQKSF